MILATTHGDGVARMRRRLDRTRRMSLVAVAPPAGRATVRLPDQLRRCSMPRLLFSNSLAAVIACGVACSSSTTDVAQNGAGGAAGSTVSSGFGGTTASSTTSAAGGGATGGTTTGGRGGAAGGPSNDAGVETRPMDSRG